MGICRSRKNNHDRTEGLSLTMDFLRSQSELYPELSEFYSEFSELYSKKLWHELSIRLELFFKNRDNLKNDNFYNLYREFISTFENRLSQVKLSQLVSYVGQSFTNPEKSMHFFESVLVNKNRLGPEATLCIEMDIVMTKIALGQFKESKSILDSSKDFIISSKSSESIVFSKYYQTLSEYFKICGPPQDFYKAGLMYLAYTPIDELSEEKKYTLATDMALGAITGESIYNFGEVITTPILESLCNTPNQWLRDIVRALHIGDVDAFNTIVDSHQQEYFGQPALSYQHEIIKRKAALLSLMNLAFERPPHQRIIYFQDIAMKAKVEIDQVEWILIKAMSLGLIKGHINEVEQQVQITWIKPRVLNFDQLKVLSCQLENWSERVKDACNSVSDQAAELFV